jgi:glycerol-3-phosphate acyltransferase PlsY
VPLVLTLLGCMTIVRHKSNIGRLIQGTEHRAKFGKSRQQAGGARP